MASCAWIFGLVLLAPSTLFARGLNHGNNMGNVIQCIQYKREFLLQYNSKPLNFNFSASILTHSINVNEGRGVLDRD